MEIFSSLAQGFSYLVGIKPILAVVVGIIMGILVGAMPGLSPSTGVALWVPFTFTLPPHIAFILLVSIYLAANYGGSITAVTINTPGTPSAAVTAIDGYQLTLKGEPGTGLGVSLIASTIGGIIGVIVLIFFSVPLAKAALKFYPSEYFALAILGLTTVASFGGKNWAKAFVAVVLGLMISTVGIDPISGVSRFTFGIPYLYDGFSLIPALIGLFALSEIFMQIEKGLEETKKLEKFKVKWPKFLDYWKLKATIFRSSIIGTIIGIFPGAGATIAAFISYDVARRSSKHPELFGKGNPEGVAAAEAANSSSVGGALIPLLTLGIPGSATDAVLLGAMMIHGLNPGPRLFVTHPEVVYSIFSSLLVANFLMLLMGLLGSRLWVKIAAVNKKILNPLIFAIAIIGSFAVKYSIFDVISCMGFGLLGWILKRYGFPVAPVVLGMVLGDMVETNFRRALIMGGYSIFIKRPLSLIMLLVALISFLYPIIKGEGKKRGGES